MMNIGGLLSIIMLTMAVIITGMMIAVMIIGGGMAMMMATVKAMPS